MLCKTSTNESLQHTTDTKPFHFKQTPTSQTTMKEHPGLVICRQLMKKRGVHSTIAMSTAGFRYTGDGDTVRCDTCELEISHWTSDMNPFTTHSQHSPTCEFVLSILRPDTPLAPTTNNVHLITTMSDNGEPPSKKLKTSTTDAKTVSNIFIEMDSLKQVRNRSFSHWPHHTSPSSTQMIEAGFFNCNVGDRVICIYCNLICQQWTQDSDDPCEVHKTLSPKCPYVMTCLTNPQTSSIVIMNDVSNNDRTSTFDNVDSFPSNALVYMTACNTNYMEIPKRYASFANWQNENLPAVDGLVEAGFFYTGSKTIVTCFYCNGSLQNWGPNDNPMIEHARWFPHCAYAKQLCGEKFYRKIQESKRAQQERANSRSMSNRYETSGSSSTHRQLSITDKKTLARLVAARLDLDISQKLLDRNFKLSIIKRCWEDQLRLKGADFVSDSDLLMACTILQKQIEVIGGEIENIIIPGLAMRKLREQNEKSDESVDPSNNNDTEMVTSSSSESDSNPTTSTSSEMAENKSQENEMEQGNSSDEKKENGSLPANPCVLCLEKEKQLACMPCGHVATCVPCGHSLRSCPICRCQIKAFVRVYV